MAEGGLDAGWAASGSWTVVAAGQHKLAATTVASPPAEAGKGASSGDWIDGACWWLELGNRWWSNLGSNDGSSSNSLHGQQMMNRGREE